MLLFDTETHSESGYNSRSPLPPKILGPKATTRVTKEPPMNLYDLIVGLQRRNIFFQLLEPFCSQCWKNIFRLCEMCLIWGDSYHYLWNHCRRVAELKYYYFIFLPVTAFTFLLKSKYSKTRSGWVLSTSINTKTWMMSINLLVQKKTIISWLLFFTLV